MRYKTCLQCGKRFSAHTAKQLYCDDLCGSRYRAKQYAVAPPYLPPQNFAPGFGLQPQATVNIRLVAQSASALAALQSDMALKYGTNFQPGNVQPGRKGGYIAYATLIVAIQAPDAPSQEYEP